MSQGRYVKVETWQNLVEPTDRKLSQGVEEIYEEIFAKRIYSGLVTSEMS